MYKNTSPNSTLAKIFNENNLKINSPTAEKNDSKKTPINKRKQQHNRN